MLNKSTSFLLVLCALYAFVNHVVAIESDTDYRLDQSVIPLNYNLEIKPYLLENEEIGKYRFSFDGSVEIMVSIQRQNVSKIVLHSKDLFIQEMSLRSVNGEDISLDPYEFITETDKLIITLEKKQQILDMNKLYVLTLRYTGVLSDDLRGFFKSIYNENGEEKFLAATHFAPTHARRAFPCFDEPNYRAPFDIVVNCHQFIRTVRSNTDLKKKVVTENNRVKYHFTRTPAMPTYLVAFLLADFEMRTNNKPTPISMFSRKEFYNHTQYGLDVAEVALDILDEYTGYPYSNMRLGKLDLVAVPDFLPNAMENWGLVKFREKRLFYDETYTPATTQQSILQAIVHELSHMWFGNTLTCKWWSFTWLNEGFATYFEHVIGQEVENTWQLENQFVVDRLQPILITDSDTGTHPLTKIDVASPGQINKMFNHITYDKGAAIIRMIAHMLGPMRIQNAMKKYLEKKGAVEPSDLLYALHSQWTETKNGNLNRIFVDFTEQSGYPLLHVAVSSDKKLVTISQESFHLDKLLPKIIQKWEVPISYTTNIEKNFEWTAPQIFYIKNLPNVSFEVGPIDWIILNIQQTGYYRVDYDENNWDRLAAALKKDQHSDIHELNRAQVVDDLLNLARTGRKPYSRVFQLIDFVRKDESYFTWKATLNGLSFIASRVTKEHEPVFKRFVVGFLKNIYSRLQFKNSDKDNHLTLLHRDNILRWACKYGHKDCVVKAQMQGVGVDVHKELREISLCTNIRENVSNAFSTVLKQFSEKLPPSEQLLLLNSLACSKSQAELEVLLQLILSDKVRRQDKVNAIKSIYTSNYEGVDFLFNYILLNYRNLVSVFNQPLVIAQMLLDTSNYFTTREQLEKLRSFYSTHKNNFYEMQQEFDQMFRKINANLKWDQDVLPDFLDVAKKYKPKPSAGWNLNASISFVLMLAVIQKFF